MYSTNTIYLQSEPIKTGFLRQYVIPGAPVFAGPYIHRIQSLALTWDFTLFGSYYGTHEAEHRSRFAEHLKLLPRAFPKLTRLRLVLEDATYYRTVPPDSSLEDLEAVILRPILLAGTKVRGLRDFIVFIETAIFDVISRRADDEGLLRRSHNSRWTTHVRYPFTTGSPDECAQPEVGYWIETGPESDLFWRPDGTSFLRSHLGAHGSGLWT